MSSFPAAEAVVPRLIVLDSAGSTNDELAARAAGAPAYTTVVTTDQTAGRGRRDRSWSTPPGLIAQGRTIRMIYAFQSENEDAPTKTVEQLEQELEMDESLVRNALSFWRSKQVLRETENDTYTVIENLSTQDHQGAAAPIPMELEDPAVSAVKSQQDLLNENAELYKTFIMGMLTNQGNMPLMRIFMMLKVIVPGGFGFGMEEVRGLLDGLVSEGKVAGQGDVFGIKRD